MGSSIRESIDVCKSTGGFSVAIPCVDKDLIVVFVCRAGSEDNEVYQLELVARSYDSGKLRFSLPDVFYGFPIGYYNADIYYGDAFIRRIRLNLLVNMSSGKTSSLESVSGCSVSVEPNTELVVDCSDCTAESVCDNNECECGCDECDCGDATESESQRIADIINEQLVQECEESD